MSRTPEYIERRCAINEIVLHALGELIAAHIPAIQPQLSRIGEAWDSALDELDAEFPDAQTDSSP